MSFIHTIEQGEDKDIPYNKFQFFILSGNPEYRGHFPDHWPTEIHVTPDVHKQPFYKLCVGSLHRPFPSRSSLMKIFASQMIRLPVYRHARRFLLSLVCVTELTFSVVSGHWFLRSVFGCPLADSCYVEFRLKSVWNFPVGSLSNQLRYSQIDRV